MARDKRVKETRSLRERAKRELGVLKRWLEKERAAVGFVRPKERECFVIDAKGNNMVIGERTGKCPHGERSYVMEAKTSWRERSH